MIEYRCPRGHLIFKHEVLVKGLISGKIQYKCFRCKKIYTEFVRVGTLQ